MTVLQASIILLISIIICFIFRPRMAASETKKESVSLLLRVRSPLFCLLITAIAAVQLSLFPLNTYYGDIDPSVFMYIGKMMHKGYIPYTQLFDHKGPLLYFIQYLGFLLSPNSYVGIWLIECVNLFVTVLFLHRIASLLSKDVSVQYLAVFATVVVCSIRCFISEAGNLAEEFALPWIASSLYIFLKYFKTGKYRFHEIVLLGLGFAAVCLLRLNMVAVWAFFLPVIVVQLLFKKRFSDLGICIGGFVLGILILFLPTLLYALQTGCLKAMIECYIGFNFSYSDVRWLMRIECAFLLMSILEPGVFAALLSLLPNLKNPLFWLHAFYTGITLIFCSLSGRGYHHYAIILIPTLTPFFVWAIEAIFTVGEKLFKKVRLPNNMFMPQALIGLCAILTVITATENTVPKEERVWMSTPAGTYLKETTVPDDDVLILGNYCLLYHEADRYTDNRFFFQTPPIDTSDALCDAFLKELERVSSDVILAPWKKGGWTEQSSVIGSVCELLDERVAAGEYLLEEFDTFYVYRLVNGKDNAQNG